MAPYSSGATRQSTVRPDQFGAAHSPGRDVDDGAVAVVARDVYDVLATDVDGEVPVTERAVGKLRRTPLGDGFDLCAVQGAAVQSRALDPAVEA